MTVPHEMVEVDALLRGELPVVPIVVVTPAGDSPRDAVDVAALVQAQGGVVRRIALSAAPADLDRGQQGALAGVGAAWAVDRTSLERALACDPTNEAELRWLLWNDGADLIRAPGAVTATPSIGSDVVLADRVPLTSVRSWALTEASVPSVTVVVHGAGAHPGVTERWPVRNRVPSEVLVAGATDLPDRGRIRGTANVATAIEEARGALLWFVHADVETHRESWARALRRFEDDRIDWVQVAYQLPSGTTRSSRGLVLADRALGAPAFALVRRRTLRRQDPAAPLDAWAAVVAEARGTIVTSHPVAVPVDVPARPVATLSAVAAGAGELARDLVRDVRDRTDGRSDSTDDDAAHGPTVGWVGFSGHGNFGDELVLRAGRQLLAGVELIPGGEGTHGTVLGGGTLLNADRYYQAMADRIDAPGLQRLVLGTGVVSPDVKGWSESLRGWEPFLRAGPVGVRGPHSAEHLRAWAASELPDWRGEVEVIGDPALVVTEDAASIDGLVVLAPIGASAVGQVAEAEERRQVELLLQVARAATSDGRPVRLMTAHAGDDRVALALHRQLGDAIDDVVLAHRDLDAGLRLVAAADVVVGARLHALVAAAAAGTTFLGLAYRPKVADFAASVGMQDRAAPIDRWTVEELVHAMRAGPGEATHAAMTTAVHGYREALRERAAGYLDEL